MNVRSLVVALTVAALAGGEASAHFVWVAIIAKGAGPAKAHVYFAESAEADSADLLDGIASIKVSARAAKDAKQIGVKKEVDGELGSLSADVAEGVQSLSTKVNYGVVSRKDKTFLLAYYAKYLDLASADWKTLARDESLDLDVVPTSADKGAKFNVLFRGKPVAGSEVVVIDPAVSETKATTDAAGAFEIAELKPGLYSIRAKWVVAEAGKEKDKEYGQVNHYGTLTLRVPAK